MTMEPTRALPWLRRAATSFSALRSKAGRIAWILAFAWVAAGFLASARADTAAITFNGGDFSVGYVNGSVGFSFVPTTNITVTRVGYLDGTTNLQPIISIWASTNSVITNYQFPPGSGSFAMIYTNVSLVLTAGQPYTITLRDGPISAGNPLIVQYVVQTGVPTFLAPELTNYLAQRIDTNGAFIPVGTNDFAFGPNFSYSTGGVATNLPVLRITATTTNSVIVSWPSPSTGFLLQQNGDLTTTNWSYFIGTTNDDGTNKSVTIAPPIGDLYFRLQQ